MLTKITIENYKSVEQLELELGRVNVFIGANGCGKSNILEAIAFASAASKNQLEDIFLATRGIRTTNPLMMKWAFEAENLEKDILVKMETSYCSIFCTIFINTENNWERKTSLNQPFLYYDIISRAPYNDVLELKKASKESYDSMVKFFKETEAQNFLIFAPENYFLRNNAEEEYIKPLGIRGQGLLNCLKKLYRNKEK